MLRLCSKAKIKRKKTAATTAITFTKELLTPPATAEMPPVFGPLDTIPLQIVLKLSNISGTKV